ncbi:MAG: N-acetyltransferase [Methanosphaera sp.]|nr:N-acetyltransferase [Methanosphaera sp.]
MEYIKNNYHFETLSGKHDLSNFQSDSIDLTNFLKEDALIQQEKKLNITKLVICDNEIIAYFSLLTDTLILNNVREKKLKTDIKSTLHTTSRKRNIPAIKIGKLTVDRKYTGKGLGSHILGNIMKNIALIANNEVGLRFIIVESYARAYKFYVNKNSFKNLRKDDELIEKIDKIIKRDPERTFYLYFDILKLLK